MALWGGLLVWGLTFAYAIVRYTLVGPVPATDIPLYVFNKSISSGALTLFSLSLLFGGGEHKAIARGFGLIGTWLVVAHVLTTLVLLAAGYFDSLLVDAGRLNLRGQLAILAGVAAACALFWQSRYAVLPIVGWVRRAVVLLAVLHVTALGSEGWFTSAGWHGGLPPITLLAAIIGSLGLAVGVRRLMQRGAQP